MSKEYNIQGIILQPFYSNCMFRGKVTREGSSLKGTLVDPWGKSTIEGKIEGEEKMKFVKKYENRPDLIFYSFKKESSESLIWIGAFQGAATGIGGAQCELYTERPTTNWNARMIMDKIDPQIAEVWSKDLVQTMVDEGYLEAYQDSKTKETYLKPQKGKRRPKPDNN